MNFFGDLTNSTLAGLVSGSFCGAITTPADKIKTLVQTNELSFRNATLLVIREFRTARHQVFSEMCTRAVYIGLSVAILNVINHKMPQLFPRQMKNNYTF